jgi:hypothetical protein
MAVWRCLETFDERAYACKRRESATAYVGIAPQRSVPSITHWLPGKWDQKCTAAVLMDGDCSPLRPQGWHEPTPGRRSAVILLATNRRTQPSASVMTRVWNTRLFLSGGPESETPPKALSHGIPASGGERVVADDLSRGNDDLLPQAGDLRSQRAVAL